MSSDSPLFSELLGRLYLCSDTHWQKKIGGLSPISQDIITLALTNNDHQMKLNQIIKVCKHIVDTIGNIESCDCSLADCMLELIQCACHICWVELKGEDVSFWAHVKLVFNTEFHAMNTDLHSLVIFLHPLCWQLAISQAAKGCTFRDFCRITLEIAQKWKWS